MASERGVSLVEVLVAVFLAGLVMAMGLPALKTLQPRLSLQLTSDQVAQDISLARLRALERHVPVRISYTATEARYGMTPNAAGAATWFRREIPKRVTATSFPDVTFSTRGFLTPEAPVVITLQGEGDAGTRTITVTVAGRVRVTR